MLKVTIELWPHGRSDAAEALGTVFLVNDGKGGETRGSYEASFACTAIGARPPLVQTVRVSDFERQRGAWALLHAALGELLERTEPERHADFWLNQ